MTLGKNHDSSSKNDNSNTSWSLTCTQCGSGTVVTLLPQQRFEMADRHIHSQGPGATDVSNLPWSCKILHLFIYWIIQETLMKSLSRNEMTHSIWKTLCELNIPAWLSRQESGYQQGAGLRGFYPHAVSLPQGATLWICPLACRNLAFGSWPWTCSFFQESRLHPVSVARVLFQQRFPSRDYRS